MQTTTEAARAAPSSALTNGQLAIVTAARLALNTGYRVLYPLLPFLALRFDVSLRAVSVLVTVLVACSMLSPLGGALADTRGERATMSLALLSFTAGAALCALAGSFAGFLGGYLLVGAAVALYQPAAQSYLSARTPYARRGWALGIFELSWAIAALAGVAPLMQLVQASGNATPVYAILAAAGLAALGLVRLALPPTPARGGRGHTRLDWSALRQPRVVALLAMFSLAVCAVDMIFVIQAAWLKGSFGADDARLGQVFAMMGIAELLGAVGSTVLVDRLGKKRAVLLGFGLTAACVALLPFSDGNWLAFLPLFFCFDLLFEFAIVSSFPLASGVAPAMRASVMALAVAANGIGRAAGSLIAEPVWREFGIAASAAVAATLMLAGVLLCARFVRETERELHKAG
jgi:DHA1 family inner membrane transport protein